MRVIAGQVQSDTERRRDLNTKIYLRKEKRKERKKERLFENSEFLFSALISLG